MGLMLALTLGWGDLAGGSGRTEPLPASNPPQWAEAAQEEDFPLRDAILTMASADVRAEEADRREGETLPARGDGEQTQLSDERQAAATGADGAGWSLFDEIGRFFARLLTGG